MRIVLIGQQAFAADVLKGLIVKEEVLAVYCPADKRGDIVAAAALSSDISVNRPQNYKDRGVINDFRKLKADLAVMAFVTDIIPLEIIDAPVLGTIQYHPSLLPVHRGGSSINWSIIRGEERTGLTIFWPDAGIDTGPILLQKEVEISPEDTAGSLYFEKLYPLGIKALLEGVDLVKANKAPRIPQDESVATYEGLCTEKDTVIDWTLPATRICNLIRGANPKPGAGTMFRGKRLEIIDAELFAAEVQQPGRITDVGKDAFVVSSGKGSVKVKRVRYAAGVKMPAEDFINESNLQPGICLG